MGVTARSAKNRQHSTPDINITPLVDVVLVLLIIFMVVAPAINEGAAIELPKVLTPDEKPRDIDPIEVLIAEDGTVIVEEKHITMPELRPALVKLHADDEKRSLLLKSDERAKYQRLRETFALVQDIGFKGILLKVIPRS
jgi:biopolymer transport protein ExbD/biopolymer transport protein TolR